MKTKSRKKSPATAILKTSDEAKSARLDSGAHFECHVCKTIAPVYEGTGPCCSKYAIEPDGRLICLQCADESQRESLKDRSQKFVGYVSQDGGSITTWTGGFLMKITSKRRVALTRQSWTHGRFIQSIRAVDGHGGAWIGQGSPGTAIKLRPCGRRPYETWSPYVDAPCKNTSPGLN